MQVGLAWQFDHLQALCRKRHVGAARSIAQHHSNHSNHSQCSADQRFRHLVTQSHYARQIRYTTLTKTLQQRYGPFQSLPGCGTPAAQSLQWLRTLSSTPHQPTFSHHQRGHHPSHLQPWFSPGPSRILQMFVTALLKTCLQQVKPLLWRRLGQLPRIRRGSGRSS